MRQRALPNLIIAGVNKAGTTSVFTYLSAHPEICASRKKETCYFLPLRYGREIRPLYAYERFFEHCDRQKYIVESTPGYFYGGKSLAKTIKALLGNVKIIIVFRDPVDRLFSFYKSQKSMLELSKGISFGEYIEKCESLGDKAIHQEFNKYSGVMCGFYANYLDAWLETFGAENVKTLFFDDLLSNTRTFLKGICHWLHIDNNIYHDGSFSVENKSVDYKNRTFHRLARRLNARLEKLARKRPSLKQEIRGIYFKLNTVAFEETMTDGEREYLNSLYLESNLAVSSMLTKNGYRRLPKWLCNPAR
jgi:hypothetical protein